MGQERQNHETKETSPISITELRILIHPFATVVSEKPKNALSPYQRATLPLAVYIANHFPPTKPTEVSLIMPFEGLLEGNPHDLNTSYGIFEALNNNTPSDCRNVIKINDILTNPAPPETIIDTLEHHGFTITPYTTIILGGELLDGCVASMAAMLLLLPEIRKVRIDKSAVLGSSAHSRGIDQKPTPSEFEQAKAIIGTGYSITEDINNLIIEKNDCP